MRWSASSSASASPFPAGAGAAGRHEARYAHHRGADESVAAKFDAGEPVSLECAALKYHASEAVGRVADRAVQISGGAGYMAEYKVERFYRDVRLLRIYEGTSQIQQTIIAKDDPPGRTGLRRARTSCAEPPSSPPSAPPSANMADR
jgi:alkylation response protein AidB-like acyl-CoA dehydrogenase